MARKKCVMMLLRRSVWVVGGLVRRLVCSYRLGLEVAVWSRALVARLLFEETSRLFWGGRRAKEEEKGQGGHHIGYRQPQIEDCKWNTSEGLEPLGNGMNQRQMSNSTLWNQTGCQTCESGQQLIAKYFSSESNLFFYPSAPRVKIIIDGLNLHSSLLQRWSRGPTCHKNCTPVTWHQASVYVVLTS